MDGVGVSPAGGSGPPGRTFEKGATAGCGPAAARSKRERSMALSLRHQCVEGAIQSHRPHRLEVHSQQLAHRAAFARPAPSGAPVRYGVVQSGPVARYRRAGSRHPARAARATPRVPPLPRTRRSRPPGTLTMCSDPGKRPSWTSAMNSLNPATRSACISSFILYRRRYCLSAAGRGSGCCRARLPRTGTGCPRRSPRRWTR